MDPLLEIIKKHWGYDSFLPLQREAMSCALENRDSLTVLPTGGGKSLCFQAPALVAEGLTVVVSPLISLMKDQVDALTENGVPAARLDSSQTDFEQSESRKRLADGSLKLIYVSPERLMAPETANLFENSKLSAIIIDEAHCVSMWGHDFRPEYRRLGELRKNFPDVAVHAFTATATEKVRQDIVKQLRLKDSLTLVGSFDRPNLIYHVARMKQKLKQVTEVIDKHPGDSGIIYCISRKNVESLSESLREEGYKVRPYHAGLEADVRKKNQDAFITEKIDIIVATVAFGMGIDKSNVRFVIHAGMPKSIEHYQQESGRAGRDGLEAECHLLFSGGDYGLWKRILEGGENGESGEGLAISLRKLGEINDFCTGVNCRHAQLVGYFGQRLDGESCGACDICLGNFDTADDSLIIAQKIISCVIRLDQRFGAAYTTQVLVGSKEQRIMDLRHNTLSTYGLLSDFRPRAVRDWVEQLVGQGFIEKSGEFNVLTVTESARAVLRGEVTPRLLKASGKPEKTSAKLEKNWEGVDRELFERLRELRKTVAERNSFPPYVVFHDSSLRDMARQKPQDRTGFLEVHGVGESKVKQYADEFLEVIREFVNN